MSRFKFQLQFSLSGAVALVVLLTACSGKHNYSPASLNDLVPVDPAFGIHSQTESQTSEPYMVEISGYPVVYAGKAAIQRGNILVFCGERKKWRDSDTFPEWVRVKGKLYRVDDDSSLLGYQLVIHPCIPYYGVTNLDIPKKRLEQLSDSVNVAPTPDQEWVGSTITIHGEFRHDYYPGIRVTTTGAFFLCIDQDFDELQEREMVTISGVFMYIPPTFLDQRAISGAWEPKGDILYLKQCEVLSR